MSMSPVGPEFEGELRSLLAGGQKIEAIRRYRERTGVGLAEAKDAVEALEGGGSPGYTPTSRSGTCGCVGCLLLVLLLAGGIALVYFGTRQSGTEIRVRLSGTPGVKVEGTYTSDGEKQDFRGTLPAEFEVKASRLAYTIRKTEEAGEIKGELFVDGKLEGSSTTPAPYGGVTGEIRLGNGLFGGRSMMLSTVSA
ncbi:MAG: hypothetical protein HYS13_24275, partial [Planctomycetia bacterium]|nr:hypothetical protein [Planctomycetia bacterium]